MKIIKRILAVLVLFIALIFIVALFVRNDYRVEREITINKPKNEVFAYVKNIRNQEYYNKWVMADPKMEKKFKGTDGTVGFVYGWSGDKEVGAGEQEITNIKEGEYINCELRFKRPMENIAATQIVTQSVSKNETKVKWSMAGKSKYPMNVMNIFIDKLLGKDMETSLTMLKNNLEKKLGTSN